MKGERDHDVFQYEIAQMIADSASTEEASAALTQAHLARLQMEEKAKKEAAEERGDGCRPRQSRGTRRSTSPPRSTPHSRLAEGG